MALQATPLNPVASSERAATQAATPSILCAVDVAALRKDVIGAFASHDSNRLAGLILWGGYGSGAAVADIKAMGQLMRQPLLDIRVSGDPAAAGSSEPPSDADPMPHTLVLHTASKDGDDNPQELRFGIVRSAGCLWLRNAD